MVRSERGARVRSEDVRVVMGCQHGTYPYGDRLTRGLAEVNALEVRLPPPVRLTFCDTGASGFQS